MSFKAVGRFFAEILALVALLSGAAAEAAALPPSVTVSFSPPTIQFGSSSQLIFSITNNDSSVPIVSGLASHNYPSVLNTGVSSTGCGGAIVLNASTGASGMSISGISLPPLASCSVFIGVNTAAPGTYTTFFPAGGFTGETGANTIDSAPATLTVNPPVAPVVRAFFTNPTIAEGSTSQLGISIYNADQYITLNGGTTSPFAYPPLINTGTITSTSCAGAVLTPGANSMSISGVSLTPDNTCYVYIGFTTPGPGTYTTTFPAGGFSGSTGPNAASPSTTLTVLPTIFVTNTLDDLNPGSLRNAINTLNTTGCVSGAAIHFNIAGPGAGPPYTITPTSQLPAITCSGAIIDGYTQSGAQRNSDALGGNNAAIQVALGGSACSGCDGLQIQANSATVQGLAIHSFAGSGILMTSGSATILGNYIGTDPGGMNAFGNSAAGVRATAGTLNLGDGSPQGRNLVSANGVGVRIEASARASISDNQVGGKRDGSSGNGNTGQGIYFNGVISCCNSADSNFVRYNGGAGIALDATTSGRVTFIGNSSYTNNGIGIDVLDNGFTDNDEALFPYDIDGVQNFPRITSVVHVGGNSVVSGYLKSTANYSATIQLYHNSVLRSQTEGEKLIDVFSASLDATGFLSFTRTIPGFFAENVSAAVTVTNGCVVDCFFITRSSEYSPSVGVTDPLQVVNTNDSGVGSLRDAIAFVNANCAGQMITFNIPGGGVQTIRPLSALPGITCNGVMINGFSQPGSSPNSLAIGDDAVRLIEIDGALAGNVNGLRINAGSVVVRGLIIDNFQSQAAVSIGAPLGTPGIQVLGNVLGDPTGTRVKKNSAGVYIDFSATGVGIGTMAAGDRNIISGNDIGIWLNSGDASNIQNNYIGTNAAGTLGSGNDTGIDSGPAVTNLAITGNVVAASLGDGIQLTGTPSAVVHGNFIGTNQTAAAGLGNVGNGVKVGPGAGAQIGGTNAGDGNVIARNGGSGVLVFGSNIRILGNSIYQNSGLGIDLGGVSPSTAQDHCDADSGANGLQNFPPIASAVLGGGNLILSGTFDSADLVTYRFEFFSNLATDNASLRSGRTFIGSTPVVTSFPPTCTTPWSVSLPFAGAIGDLITATATDSAGNTSWFSGAIAVTAATTVPGAPVIGTASAGNAQASVTFSPPASNGGSPITSYTVTSSPGGITATGTASAILVTGLANGTSYTFTVTATNAVGTGAASAPSNAVTPNVVPAAPIMGSASAGNGQATVTFSPPPANGGTPVTSYTVTSNPSGISAVSSASPITVTGLANGTAYTFTVTATNALGSGLPSAASNVVTPTAPPGTPSAPLGVTATAGNAQATVSFSPPASNGGSPVTSYTVTSNPSGITATGPASPITVSGLSNGTAYTFTVAATNIAGAGPASAPSNSVTPATVPGAPIIGTATAGNARASVSFTPPASNGGSAIMGYVVTSSPGGISGTGSASPITVMGLTNGTVYTFTVTAVNALGVGPASAPSNAVTPVALAAGLTLTPSSLTFASRTISTTSAAQTVTLTNTGTAPLAISSITVNGDFAFTSACASSLAAGATCTLSVTFTPLAAGARTGAVTIASNATGSPHTVALSGNGQFAVAAVLQVDPTVGAFAPQELGTSSAPDTFVIVNAGNATLTFGDISVSGAGFTLLPTITGTTYTRCGATLVSGAGCAVQVSFTPTGPGAVSGALHIAGNATNSPVDVNLTASGVITVPTRALSVAASLAFDEQPVGTQSAGRALTITNQLASVVSVSDLATDGDFSVADTCSTIAAHGTCSPLVFFRPTAVGSRTGHLTIHTLSEATPYVVALNGTGTFNAVPQIELSVTRLGFGNTLLGVPVSTQVVIRNVGQVPVAIQGVTASGDFFVGHACGASIAVGSTCTLNVSFFPRMTGGTAGAVEIRTDATGSPHQVQLSGVGCALPSFARARSGGLLCGP